MRLLLPPRTYNPTRVPTYHHRRHPLTLRVITRGGSGREDGLALTAATRASHFTSVFTRTWGIQTWLGHPYLGLRLVLRRHP